VGRDAELHGTIFAPEWKRVGMAYQAKVDGALYAQQVRMLRATLGHVPFVGLLEDPLECP